MEALLANDAATGTYCHGQTPGLADCCLVPQVFNARRFGVDMAAYPTIERIEAACLPENAASRGVLEKSGFKYEGVAQSYLQIAGRWRNHVLFSNLRADRRGRTDVG